MLTHILHELAYDNPSSFWSLPPSSGIHNASIPLEVGESGGSVSVQKRMAQSLSTCSPLIHHKWLHYSRVIVPKSVAAAVGHIPSSHVRQAAAPPALQCLLLRGPTCHPSQTRQQCRPLFQRQALQHAHTVSQAVSYGNRSWPCLEKINIACWFSLAVWNMEGGALRGSGEDHPRTHIGCVLI